MLKITGKTKLLAVIGDPIEHSLSPQIHNRFIAEADLPYVYVAFAVQAQRAEKFVQAALEIGLVGFNVTMPLKEEIISSLDVLDEKAELFGAVNTVVVRDKRLYGYNTDGDGFLLSLESYGFDLVPGKVLILGAGGAAKTIAAALAQKGMQVYIAAKQAENMFFNKLSLTYCPWDKVKENSKGCALLINATPLGMDGAKEDFADFSFLDSLPPHALVYDLIYAPRETRLLKAAKDKGFHTLNGLSHLISQAALSFSIFTGKKPSPEILNELHLNLP